MENFSFPIDFAQQTGLWSDNAELAAELRNVLAEGACFVTRKQKAADSQSMSMTIPAALSTMNGSLVQSTSQPLKHRVFSAHNIFTTLVYRIAEG